MCQRVFLLLLFNTGQNKLNAAQISHRILDDEGQIILQIQLNRLAETGTLGKENQVPQLEDTIDDFVGRPRFLNFHRIGIFGHDRLLFCKISLAAENEV